jgi:hypothetical protein
VNSPKESTKLFGVIARKDGSPPNRSTENYWYILSLEKCPIGIQNFFENLSSITLLHFLASPLKTFPHAIKYTEKQDTTVIEVKNEISKRLDKINCEKPKRFLETAVRDQLQELEKEGHITIEKFNKHAEDFYDTCIEYIQELCSPFLKARPHYSCSCSCDWLCSRVMRTT